MRASRRTARLMATPALVASLAAALVASPNALGLGSAGHARSLPADAGSAPNVVIHTAYDVPYRTVGTLVLSLDVYSPATGGPYPAVLLIHGGAWKSGDKAGLSVEALKLAAGGFVAFDANYRLAPGGGTWHAPAPVTDLLAAMVWIRAHASTYRGDPSRVGALGASAGGDLAQMIGTMGAPHADRPDAVVSWSGSTFLALCGRSPDATDACKVRANYVGCSLGVCPDAWSAASPFYHVTSSTAPTYLANGSSEIVPVGEARRMGRALAAARVSYVVRVVNGTHHATAYEGVVWDDSVAFLHQYLG